MHHESPPRLSNEVPGKHLLDALLRREFAVYYQPQYDVVTGAPVAVELLLRWYHPDRGTVPASEFMPAAEASGAIVPIGAWALAAAGREAAAWFTAWPDLRLSVNVSGRQLAEPGMAQQVLESLRQAGLRPARVDVEVRPETLLAATAAARAELAALRAAGASVVLDEFGLEGHGLPAPVPVDGLKLARRLAAAVHGDGGPPASLLAAIELGRELPRGVAASGVEDPRQREDLLRLGIRRMQGFLFCRPGPASGLGSIELKNLPFRPRRA